MTLEGKTWPSFKFLTRLELKIIVTALAVSVYCGRENCLTQFHWELDTDTVAHLCDCSIMM